MKTLSVVVRLDVAEQLGPQSSQGWPRTKVYQLFLDGAEERFRDGIVIADPGLADRWSNVVLLAEGAEFAAGVLGPHRTGVRTLAGLLEREPHGPADYRAGRGRGGSDGGVVLDKGALVHAAELPGSLEAARRHGPRGLNVRTHAQL